MPVDLTVYLDHRPGQVSAVGKALGDAGVNVLGGFALVVGGQGIMHVLVEDAAATKAYQALEAQGFQTTEEEEVVVVDIEDHPGALGELTARVADVGVNITVFYLATNTRVVLGAEDLAAARQALGL